MCVCLAELAGDAAAGDEQDGSGHPSADERRRLMKAAVGAAGQGRS